MTQPPALDVSLVLSRGWPADGIGPIANVLAQIPDPLGLSSGTRVIVRARGRRGAGLLARLFGPRRKAHVAVRCTALLALGYRGVGAGRDNATGEMLAWGVAP
jgi:hypothetical protein